MTEKEMKKLSRKDLLQMLLEQSKEIRTLQDQLSVAEERLRDRQIRIDKAGSIAEASLQLSGVFEAAQEACRQYTDNIENLSKRQEQVCEQMERESRARADKMIADAEKKKAELVQSTKAECEKMMEKAKSQSQAYWDTVAQKLEQFSADHSQLQDLLSVVIGNARDKDR